MKTLDDAVVELSGVLPASRKNEGDLSLHEYPYYFKNNDFRKIFLATGFCENSFICNFEEFQQRAKELGFINGYRWGVEYPTNGKKPDLADDVLVRYWTEERCSSQNTVLSLDWRYDYNECHPIIKFKITDQRYKPADTSYLDKPKSERETISLNSTEWYDYDSQEMKTLPDNNADVELLMGGVYQTRVEYIGIHGFKVVFYRYDTHEIDHAELPTASFRPLDWNRKAKAERKRVVDAAYKEIGVVSGNAYIALEAAYDKGFLRLPD
jgi:hypothetical protein